MKTVHSSDESAIIELKEHGHRIASCACGSMFLWIKDGEHKQYMIMVAAARGPGATHFIVKNPSTCTESRCGGVK